MIAQPSDASFGIRAVSRLTGIPMDTLRAWERRYRAVIPRRSAQNRRFYSRDDVARLLLIKQLVEQGEPVGSVVHLTEAELQDQLRTHAELRHQNEGAVPASPVAQDRVATLLVYGDALPYQIKQWAPSLPELKLLGMHDEFPGFTRSAVETRPDLLLMEFPALHAGVIGQVRELLRQGGSGRAIVVYAFAARSVLVRLHGLGVLTLRAPVGMAELREACRFGTGGSGAQAHPTFQQSGYPGIPPRRYRGKELAAIAQASTRLQCECPRHVVELVAKLGAFEDYSADCEAVTEQDAVIHVRLHEATARARALLEDAMEFLLASEAVEYPAQAELGGATG